MSNINKQELREAAERAESDSWGYDRDEFNEALTPSTVLALLDELEAAEKRNVELSMLLEGADAIQTDYAEALECQDDNDSVLAAIVALKQRAESAEKHIAELRDWNLGLAQESLTHQQRIAELSGQKRLIGWRASDYTDETPDHELAKNWAAAIGVLPIFEGDVNTKLSAAGISKGE
ncbi:ead/Ea22-like family protein [Enterobacter hormaechei]|uniref:ead/Ea22-like family protein n=1 Tax=Enterobacter hormaechei TaxID=158836 RepID=UPI000797300B|nr:ead/Ea22-like family protein [Enterobacter hormaechei]CZV67882.1 Uncharacterised protein [Enterobacter hormaechei]